MRLMGVPVFASALMLAGAPAPELEFRYCGVDDQPGPPMAVAAPSMDQAESLDLSGFEDEVDLSGETAVIDIMFVYTRRSAENRGGYQFHYDTHSFREWVERLVDEASIIMLNSGANARLRLVGLVPAAAEVERFEEEGRTRGHDWWGWGSFRALKWVSESGAGERLRDEYGADLLHVMIATGEVCGVAQRPRSVARMPYNTYGTLATAIGVGCFSEVLAHEVGHNLGLIHDLAEDPIDLHTLMRPGGRGFIGEDRTGEKYGSIMSFPEWGRVNIRVRGFSTSSSTHNGRKMGEPGLHEASDAFRFAAPYAAALKRSKVEEERGACVETAQGDCLAGGRFRVSTRFWMPNGETRSASTRDVYLGDFGSLFHFFSPENPELLVKVLDGCGVNGHYWVFGSAATDLEYEVLVEDLEGGKWQEYRRHATAGAEPEQILISDTSAFVCGESSSYSSEWSSGPGAWRPGSTFVSGGPDLPPEARDIEPLPGSDAVALESAGDGLAGGCREGPGVACLVNGQFDVTVGYGHAGHQLISRENRGSRRPSTIGDNAALFYFFTWDNPELLVKVLDGCAINGHYWVFGSAATDKAYMVWVYDTRVPPYEMKTYIYNPGYYLYRDSDPPGPLFSDIEAFPCER